MYQTISDASSTNKSVNDKYNTKKKNNYNSNNNNHSSSSNYRSNVNSNNKNEKMNSRHDQSSEQQMEPNQAFIAEESSSFSILSPSSSSSSTSSTSSKSSSSSTSKNEKNMHYAPFLYATAMKSMIEVNICSAITIYFLRRFVRIDILAMRETFEISTYYPLL